MGGLFGGLIGLFNVFGGCVLYLLIGKLAWKDHQTARWWRLAIGSLVIGSGLELGDFLLDFLSPPLWVLILFPLVLMIFVFGLEGIRRSIENRSLSN